MVLINALQKFRKRSPFNQLSLYGAGSGNSLKDFDSTSACFHQPPCLFQMLANALLSVFSIAHLTVNRKISRFRPIVPLPGVARLLVRTLCRIDASPIPSASNKYRRLHGRSKKARDWLARVVGENLHLFAHWCLLYGNGRTSGAYETEKVHIRVWRELFDIHFPHFDLRSLADCCEMFPH
jgi:hypothetical protein